MDRPFLSSYKDRHGKERWRFRRGKLTRAIPGLPGEPHFEVAYNDALAGRTTAAAVIRHPNHALPRTLKAAWRLATAHDNMDWQKLGKSSRDSYIERAERLLAMEIAPGCTYADAPIADLRRRHVKQLLGAMSDRPHAAYDAFVVLRKMVLVALDEEWIEIDPTHRVKYRPKPAGHRAWTDAERATFEARWPLGSRPRTVYALALYTGQRRSDLVRYRWNDFKSDTLPVTQQKTGKELRLPILPQLREALNAADRSSDLVVPLDADTLTNYWLAWTRECGLEGCTLHGLRKTLGKILAEEGATTRELMEMLGHDSISHAELYSKEAEQARLAKRAMGKARNRLRPRLKVVGGEPYGEPLSNPQPKALKRRK